MPVAVLGRTGYIFHMASKEGQDERERAMTLTTYSTAATAKRGAERAIKKTTGLVDPVVQTFAVEDGRIAVAITVDQDLTSVAAEDLAALEGFDLRISDAQTARQEAEAAAAKEAEKAAAILDEATAPVVAPRKSRYINEVSNHGGVVAEVWAICDAIGNKYPRKTVIEICRNQGIAYGTARTQYQKWFKARKG